MENGNPFFVIEFTLHRNIICTAQLYLQGKVLYNYSVHYDLICDAHDWFLFFI